MTTTFATDLDAGSSVLAHVWSHTAGSGRAHLALRADWQAQLRRARAELGVRHVRFRGLLNTDVAATCGQRPAGDSQPSRFVVMQAQNQRSGA